MSVQTIKNGIGQVQRELERLHRALTEETKKEAQKSERITNAVHSISRATSLTTVQSKQREIQSLERDLVQIQRKKADLTKQISSRTAELHRLQQQLYKEQEREQKRFMDSLNRQAEETRRRQALILAQVRQSTVQGSSNIDGEAQPEYDVFISHATEDKEDLVRPLAEKLREIGFRVWYDEFELKLGDSLRRSIDQGLANSRFGIVVLSEHFIAKTWTQYELDGFVARESTGGKVILPLWHKISKNEVMRFSPTLADRLALNTALFTLDELVEKIAEVLKDSAE